MASVAALPVMIGLAVDYAIQFQSRFNERRAAGDAPADRGARCRARRRTDDRNGGARHLGRASSSLLLSPVPMVRGFGLIVVLGVAVALGLRSDRGLRGSGAARRATAASG